MVVGIKVFYSIKKIFFQKKLDLLHWTLLL